jgi:imidazoleglycerol phosphate synthase glutamine amidotransferase subunit HisH
LQAIFGYRNAHIYPDRVFMPGIGNLLDEAGRLTSQEMRDRLQKQADGFTAFVETLRGRKLRQTVAIP